MSDLSDDPVIQGLEVYLVGGAVRDELLGRPVADRDWVVVGATPEQMTQRGFRPVGADFPVFLHPDSHEEYALARTERKTRAGHQGFEFYAAPEVTLEQDLVRRDFTINAMARSPEGQIIDPFQGQQHLRQGVLEPVSQAFTEDPLRVVRAARFLAQMPELHESEHFHQYLPGMRDELATLSVERLWQEAYKAFSGQPGRFFQALARWDCWQALNLEPPQMAQITPGNSPENALAQWLWQTRFDAQDWLTQWRAPKRWQALHQDLANWDGAMAFACLKRAGALKNTPRSQRLLSALMAAQAIDEHATRRALAAAMGVRREDVDPNLTGPALGQALERLQQDAFERAFGPGL